LADSNQNDRSAERRLSGAEIPPLPFGDDIDLAVDHLDGGLVVDGVGRTADAGSPSFRVGHRVLRESRVVQVGEDREVDDPSVTSSPVIDGFVSTKSSPTRGVINLPVLPVPSDASLKSRPAQEPTGMTVNFWPRL